MSPTRHAVCILWNLVGLTVMFPLCGLIGIFIGAAGYHDAAFRMFEWPCEVSERLEAWRDAA